MLVMITIFISKMEGLPPTSDTKMIDYWLILCQLVPFTEVVLLTAMEFLREEEQGKREEEADESKPMHEIKVLEFKEEVNTCVAAKSELATMNTLKFIGKEKVYLANISFFLSEKKILPTIVVLFSVIFFAAAFA